MAPFWPGMPSQVPSTCPPARTLSWGVVVSSRDGVLLPSFAKLQSRLEIVRPATPASVGHDGEMVEREIVVAGVRVGVVAAR